MEDYRRNELTVMEACMQYLPLSVRWKPRVSILQPQAMIDLIGGTWVRIPHNCFNHRHETFVCGCCKLQTKLFKFLYPRGEALSDPTSGEQACKTHYTSISKGQRTKEAPRCHCYLSQKSSWSGC